MIRFSRKQIKHGWVTQQPIDPAAFSSKKNRLLSESKENWLSTTKDSKFGGMAERVELVEPVIIPGYKIWG